jgi:uncharacterized protein YdhG (YjbR/CyaY superfamily)
MKQKPKNLVPKDIDSYLAGVPEPSMSALQKIRQIIKEIVPDAEEVISYQMPAFKYHGILVYFAAFKDHCSLFPGAAVVEAFKDELKAYETSKGTIRFPADKPLPASLVKKLVRAKMKENEERKKKK